MEDELLPAAIVIRAEGPELVRVAEAEDGSLVDRETGEVLELVDVVVVVGLPELVRAA